MVLSSWFIIALVGSLFQAAFVETNRIFRADARLLNFWHVVFVLLLFVPLIPYMSWPSGQLFYVLAFIVAFGMGISTQILFGLARNHNGRVSSMYMPLEVVFAFALWTTFYPAAADEYAHDPYTQTGIFLAFCIFSISLLLIRRSDIGWNSFMFVIPVAIFFALRTVFSKVAMIGAGEGVISHALTFAFLIYLGILPLSAFLVRANGGFSTFGQLPPLKASFLCAFFALVSFLCFTISVTVAANPAYVPLVFMMVPVWLLILHLVTGVRDDASPLAGLTMVAGAAILLWFVA